MLPILPNYIKSIQEMGLPLFFTAFGQFAAGVANVFPHLAES
jgi:hypothetical protein